MTEHVYLIMDARAINDEGEARATVFEVCDTLKEARETAPEYGVGCCIWEGDIIDGTMKNSTFVEIVL